MRSAGRRRRRPRRPVAPGPPPARPGGPPPCPPPENPRPRGVPLMATATPTRPTRRPMVRPTARPTAQCAVAPRLPGRHGRRGRHARARRVRRRGRGRCRRGDAHGHRRLGARGNPREPAADRVHRLLHDLRPARRRRDARRHRGGHGRRGAAGVPAGLRRHPQGRDADRAQLRGDRGPVARPHPRHPGAVAARGPRHPAVGDRSRRSCSRPPPTREAGASGRSGPPTR